MNNLFISYDLHAPVKNYERVISAIKALGAVPVLKSMWYLTTQHGSKAVAEAIWAAMDRDDSLHVVDATRNTAHWFNLNPQVEQFMQAQWTK